MSGQIGFLMEAVKCQVTRCNEWVTTLRPVGDDAIWVCANHAHLYPYPKPGQ